MIILGKESSRKIQALEKAPKVRKKKAENEFSALSIFGISNFLVKLPTFATTNCCEARKEIRSRNEDQRPRDQRGR